MGEPGPHIRGSQTSGSVRRLTGTSITESPLPVHIKVAEEAQGRKEQRGRLETTVHSWHKDFMEKERLQGRLLWGGKNGGGIKIARLRRAFLFKGVLGVPP